MSILFYYLTKIKIVSNEISMLQRLSIHMLVKVKFKQCMKSIHQNYIHTIGITKYDAYNEMHIMGGATECRETDCPGDRVPSDRGPREKISNDCH